MSQSFLIKVVVLNLSQVHDKPIEVGTLWKLSQSFLIKVVVLNVSLSSMGDTYGEVVSIDCLNPF